MAKTASSSAILKPISVLSVTDTVMERLETQIINGEIEEGEKLPSEEELAKQAGIGRRSMREALKALEMKGLITIRKGSGAFVVRNDFNNYLETLNRNVQAYLRLDRAKLRHLLQYRELLTGSIIGILTESPQPQVISRLRISISAQEAAYKSRSAGRYAKAHLDFHFEIINSVNNPIVTMMYTQVIKLLEPYMRKSAEVQKNMRSAIQEHKDIVAAMESGDTARAHYAFHSHLVVSLAHLEEVI